MAICLIGTLAFLCSVYNQVVPDGKSGQQTVDMMQRRLEALGATKCGTFSLDCETWQSQLREYILAECQSGSNLNTNYIYQKNISMIRATNCSLVMLMVLKIRLYSVILNPYACYMHDTMYKCPMV